nr:response regulator [uncultured Pseudodesulfovibrio sp.]
MTDITVKFMNDLTVFVESPLFVAALTALICLWIHLLWRKATRRTYDADADKQYKDAQRLAHIGHWEYSIHDNHLIWSDEVYRIFAIEKHEFDNTLDSFFDLIPPDDRHAIHTQYAHAIQNHEDYEGIHRIIRKNGETIYVREHCQTFFDKRGNATRSLGTIQDVTEQEVTKNELRQAKYKAEAATRTKSAFLATMSHEIRTPLNGILGMLQLLTTTPLDQEQDEYVSLAITSSERLSDLLCDILELTELETDRIKLGRELFNFHNTVSDIVDIFSNKAAQKGILLQLHISSDIPTLLMGDEVRLRHVLFNLIGNAVKFTDQGSVSINVVMLSGSFEGKMTVLFTIIDTGPGIPDDILHMIHESFTQATDVSVRKHGGAGLGLSIVQGLTKLMCGSLTISTEEEVGTKIFLSLPLESADADISYPRPPQQECKCPSAGRKVLLVEDDAINQTAIGTLLRKQGLHVDIAKNGREALSKVRNDNHQLIFMDIQMPVMDGMQATQAIREGGAGIDKTNIPIIAITTYSIADDRKRFIQAGMNDYLAKPVSLEGLLKVLDREIGQTVTG